MLEEVGLPYSVEVIDFAAGGHRSPAFLDISPLEKVPLLVDSETNVTVAETLAEKTGQLPPGTLAEHALWREDIVKRPAVIKGMAVTG